MRNLIILAGMVLVAAAGYLVWMSMQAQHPGHQQNSGQQQSGMDMRTEKPSDNGLYTVSFMPSEGEPTTGPISVWHLKITDPSGKPVTGAEVVVDGGMPAHGHGLPTVPAATGEAEPGVYLIDGIKFSMVGHWKFDVTIRAEAGEDTVSFNRMLE
ncbi:MAG: FixH family protein [Phyllobacteriaceae bacterium]|nr:FixH family protein [Phyllobacteriaceae bacterium]